MASTVTSLPTALFDYPLPPDRIAQRPLARRDASRLLHLTGSGVEDRGFRDLPDLLSPGDLLVVNDTRVRAARLRGRRADGGGPAEVLVLTALDDGRHACLVRPARRLPPGAVVEVPGGLRAHVGEPVPGHPGARAVRLEAEDGDVDAAVERAGTVPLPPYIRQRLDDPGRYQTVYAGAAPRSAAAPTAGLHFTPEVLDALRARGVVVAAVRLEVGLGTFAPIRVEAVDEHRMHEERFALPAEAADAVAAARDRGGRVVAVGTTVVRVLESCATAGGRVCARQGETRLYLQPGSPFRVVDGLLTNFHQPRSSLLVMVSAFAGVERVRSAYAHALSGGYRFLSFGDCMLCWRAQA